MYAFMQISTFTNDILIFPSSITLRVEADRDILDWSGKKPLDYQKQSSNISASFTFNSEYRRNQTLPSRMHVVELSNRSKVQRSYSTMLDDSIRGFFDTNSGNSVVESKKHDDTVSLAGAVSSMTIDFERGMKRKSKKHSRSSFLRKSNKHK